MVGRIYGQIQPFLAEFSNLPDKLPDELTTFQRNVAVVVCAEARPQSAGE